MRHESESRYRLGSQIPTCYLCSSAVPSNRYASLKHVLRPNLRRHAPWKSDCMLALGKKAAESCITLAAPPSFESLAIDGPDAQSTIGRASHCKLACAFDGFVGLDGVALDRVGP